MRATARPSDAQPRVEDVRNPMAFTPSAAETRRPRTGNAIKSRWVYTGARMVARTARSASKRSRRAVDSAHSASPKGAPVSWATVWTAASTRQASPSDAVTSATARTSGSPRLTRSFMSRMSSASWDWSSLSTSSCHALVGDRPAPINTASRAAIPATRREWLEGFWSNGDNAKTVSFQQNKPA